MDGTIKPGNYLILADHLSVQRAHLKTILNKTWHGIRGALKDLRSNNKKLKIVKVA